MNINNIKSVYFVGAGGIGMSAIARYFLKKGLIVGGYDKTPSDLTRQLEKEGMLIHYEEDINQIPQACKNQQECLVIYTPAIPAEHKELCYFQENGFEIQKRDSAWQVHMVRPQPLRCVHTSCIRAIWIAMLS